MEWRCATCDRSYAEPPNMCACGTAALEPVEGGDDRSASRFSLPGLRRRLVDPEAADRGLVRDEPYVTLVFRFLLVVALLGAAMLVVLAFV